VMSDELTVEQTNDDVEEIFVAVSGDGTVRRVDRSEVEEEDSMAFSSTDDLMRLDKDQLESIRAKLIKAPVGKAGSKAEAAELCWMAMLAASAPRPAETPKDEKKKAAKGGGGPRASETLTLKYDFDNPGNKEEGFKKLPPQARTCLEIMARADKKEFSSDALKKLIEAHGSELKTRQEPWRIFQYYRNKLKNQGFIEAKAA
jgi:hypothetical protein